MTLIVPLDEIFSKEKGLLAKHHTWSRVELSEIAKVQNGFPLESNLFSKDNGFPIIRIRDLEQNKPSTYYKGTFPHEYTVNNDDILIGMDGIFRVQKWKGGSAVLNQRLCRVIPDEKKYLKEFLYLVLQGYLSAIENHTSSQTVKHLSSKDILKIPLPFPPLCEQKRIVTKLHKLLTKVEESKIRLEKIPGILKRFRQAILYKAVTGELTKDYNSKYGENVYFDDNYCFPKTWQILTIESLVKSIKKDLRTGPFGSSLKKSEHTKMGVPVWGIESIGLFGEFNNFNKIFVSLEKAEELKSFRVTGNDIIVSRSGTVGELCILPNSIPISLISTNLMKISLDKKVIDPLYFCYLFKGSELVLEKLKELCSGSTRLFLTQKILKKLWFPTPPLEEQKEIVKRVSALLKKADEIEERYKKAKCHIDKITQSILAKAFRGELV